LVVHQGVGVARQCSSQGVGSHLQLAAALYAAQQPVTALLIACAIGYALAYLIHWR
jgi:hypothetical protein